MGLFQKKIGPVFLKECSDTADFIEKMSTLAEKSDGELKEKIEREIKLASYGLTGEKNIAFELKNSGIDMYILHDLYFEYNDMQAQIDYMIFTRKRVYVIECKNLIGDIEIDNNGNFIRTYELFGKKVKEGLYSPITQNERHRLVIKNLRAQEKNLITRAFFEKNFDNTYISLIVLANPKTCLNAKYAKKDIKNQVVRADQLIARIKELDSEITNNIDSIDEINKLAHFYLEKSIANKSDYAKKYEDMLSAITTKDEEKNITKDNLIKTCPRCGAELILRTAQKGNNIGKQFYGCKSFPKCRYVENVE